MTGKTSVHIDIASQSIRLLVDGVEQAVWPVSTALNGPGEAQDSGCTPRGRHRVRICIGQGCPENAVFRGRRFTGEILTPELQESCPERDWILTRIIWLTGCESGFNRGGEVDTLRRYIYIHGTPDSEPMGVPRSHGCIRMRNADVIQLAEQLGAGVPVVIT